MMYFTLVLPVYLLVLKWKVFCGNNISVFTRLWSCSSQKPQVMFEEQIWRNTEVSGSETRLQMEQFTSDSNLHHRDVTAEHGSARISTDQHGLTRFNTVRHVHPRVASYLFWQTEKISERLHEYSHADVPHSPADRRQAGRCWCLHVPSEMLEIWLLSAHKSTRS